MWLALGCVSARQLYWMVKDYEAKNRPNDSTKAFVFELLWRDYFKFLTLKYGKKLFFLRGCLSSPAGATKNAESMQSPARSFSAASNASYSSSAPTYNRLWNRDKNLFEKWCNGDTGYPFVDVSDVNFHMHTFNKMVN